jgi:hypothetical protein
MRPVASGDRRLEFLCECGDISCKERIALTPAKYEAVRAESRQFVLKPGHELLESEEVVQKGERFVVVRKFGAAGEVAEELDSRSPASSRTRLR